MAKIKLTPGRITSASCDSGQSFLWDSIVHGLGVRITSNGNKAFVIQARHSGKPLRITIGNVCSITLEDARKEARKLLLMIEQGLDPRREKERLSENNKADDAARAEQSAKERVLSLKVFEVWQEYIIDRKPYWGTRHYQDHIRLSQSGDVPAKKGNRNLKPGPLAPLMQLSLADLTAERIESWLKKEIADRPAQTRLAYTAFKTFIAWCGDHSDYQTIVSSSILTNRVRGILPKKKAKSDCLQKEQLSGWFSSVRQIQNPIISAYLQALLLTGARREELAHLKWTDIDFRWKSITIRDKVEGLRVIPLTPYVEQLLNWLPRRNEWVFSSLTAASGRVQEPRIAHNKALAIAGIEGLTLHGLRRSFGSLAEWTETPTGIVAQIMG
ncbi:MAG: integrase family protein, partial [Chlorobium sp.]|nr:integrase family protein [Chlorobium sp.]